MKSQRDTLSEMQQRRLFFDSSFEPMNWWNATGERRDSSFKWGWGWKLEWEVNTAAKEETIHFFFTFKYINAPHQSVTMQFKKKNWKNVNRMTPLSGSQIYKPDEVHLPPIRFAIFLPYDNWTGWRPVHNLQTGWHPHPVHSVNNLWTGRQVVRFSNFKKWEPDGLIRVPCQKFSSCLIKEGYLDNFNKSSCEIKILHGVQEEGMGVEEEFDLYWNFFFLE